MYTSTVVISSLYLAEMAAVSAVSCCSKTMTCGCVAVFETSNYIGDLFIVAGVIWQAAAQSSLALEESEADTDAAAVGYLLLLALCSSLLVVFSGALRRMPLAMWVGFVFLRTAAAALLVYTLLNGVAAPGGVQILMVSGAVVDGLLPWNNFPVRGES